MAYLDNLENTPLHKLRNDDRKENIVVFTTFLRVSHADSIAVIGNMIKHNGYLQNYRCLN